MWVLVHIDEIVYNSFQSRRCTSSKCNCFNLASLTFYILYKRDKVTVTINAYERSAKARAACIAHNGASCAVCSFDFKNVFGDLGAVFIHVHHIVHIGSIQDEYEVDPITDLIPVCPNCHAMIHRVEPPLAVDQLREHLTTIKNANKTEQATPNGAPVL